MLETPDALFETIERDPWQAIAHVARYLTARPEIRARDVVR